MSATRALYELAAKLEEYAAKPQANAGYVQQQRARLEAIAGELEQLRGLVDALEEARGRAYREGAAEMRRRMERERPGRNALIAEMGYEGYREWHNGFRRDKWKDHFEQWTPEPGKAYRMTKGGGIEEIVCKPPGPGGEAV